MQIKPGQTSFYLYFYCHESTQAELTSLNSVFSSLASVTIKKYQRVTLPLINVTVNKGRLTSHDIQEELFVRNSIKNLSLQTGVCLNKGKDWRSCWSLF